MNSNGIKPFWLRSGLGRRVFSLFRLTGFRWTKDKPLTLTQASKVGTSLIDDNCRAFWTMSSIGCRTVWEPQTFGHCVRPRYLTRKYCGRTSLKWVDTINESSFICCPSNFIWMASGVNGGGSSSLCLFSDRFVFRKSLWMFVIPLESVVLSFEFRCRLISDNFDFELMRGAYGGVMSEGVDGRLPSRDAWYRIDGE